MIPYLQIELKDNPTSGMPPIIGADEAIIFDNIIATSTYDSAEGSQQSISYDETTGIFGIKRAGVYFVNWFVSQQTGLSYQGSNFGVVIDPNATTSQTIVGSGHVKISPSSAFALIAVSEAEAATPTGKQFVLKNVSSHDAALSERSQVKAGLSVFGFSDDLFNKIAYGQWQASGWDKGTDPYDLNDGQAIKFNNSLLNPVGIVATDSENGSGTRNGYDIFTLQSPGVYQISWEVPIEASYQVDSVELALELNGTTVFSKAYSPLPVGIVTGTAIVNSTLFDTNLKLVNYQPDAGDIIQLGNYANLTIHRIS